MHSVWLIGAGPMARDYIKILNALQIEFTIIGRSTENITKLFDDFGIAGISGGIDSFLASNPTPCTHAIVATGTETLYETAKSLIHYGIKNVLIEKPGALLAQEFIDLNELISQTATKAYVAYNRRFYASVLEGEKIIANDGGITSFQFEFTEWSHVIEPLKKAAGTKEQWFIGNSTHVVDLAFFLGGDPKELATFTAGALSWHPTASIFSGAGLTSNGIPFSYHANWESAGRWSLEVQTNHHRLIYRPMEQLMIQKRGSIAIETVEIDDHLDKDYKPGLYQQTYAFLNGDTKRLCTYAHQTKQLEIYNKMANYQ